MKYWIIGLIIGFNLASLRAQVYFSQINDSIFLGPENVSGYDSIDVERMIAAIEDQITELEGPEERIDEQIDILLKKDSLGGKNPRLLANLKSQMKIVSGEISNLSQLRQEWEMIESHEEESSSDGLMMQIPYEDVPPKVEWVKRKDENCQAPDPDDCLIWCKETIPAAIQCVDSYQQLYKSQGCPEGWDKAEGHCFKKVAKGWLPTQSLRE